MNSILVPVDFSAPSKQAFKYAAALAYKMKASLTLMHVLPPSTTVLPYSVVGIDLNTKETRKMQAKLERWSQLPFMKKVPVEVIARESTSASAAIADETMNRKYMMIVMGAKGATNLKEKWMGTVTQKVMASVDLPVLAVPARAEFTGLRKVIFAIDFWKREFGAAKKLEKLLLPLNPRILLTHISTGDSLDEATQKKYVAEIQSRIKGLKSAFIDISSDDVLNGLSAAAKEYGAGMIVMVTEETTWLERMFIPSLTRQLALRTRIPLLAIKSES